MSDTLLQNYLSGMISGVNAILISHPIDTIKTNIQEKKPLTKSSGFQTYQCFVVVGGKGWGLKESHNGQDRSDWDVVAI